MRDGFHTLLLAFASDVKLCWYGLGLLNISLWYIAPGLAEMMLIQR